jgi:hypothetical protein
MTTKKKAAEPEIGAGVISFMDQAEIHGYPIREWNTQQFVVLYPEIKHIATTLSEAGITLETIESTIAGNMMTFADAVIPCIPNILKYSCPNKDQSERDNLPFPAALQITMALLKRNMDHIADFFDPSPK